MIEIEVFKKESLITKCNYIYIDEYSMDHFYIRGNYYDEVYYLSLFNLKENQNLLKEHTDYVVIVNIKKLSGEIVTLTKLKITCLQDVLLKSNGNTNFACIIDFSDEEEEYTYRDYNQPLLALYNDWNENNINTIENMKCTPLYTTAALYISGVPNNISFDKSILIDGEKIYSIYHFYNVLAELLLGEKRYIASNLDSLKDSLNCCSINKESNNNRIKIINYNYLKTIFESQLDDYLKIFTETMTSFGFQITIEN